MPALSPLLVDGLWAQAAFALLFPPLLGLIAKRHLRVGWNWWVYGMRFCLLAIVFVTGGNFIVGFLDGFYRTVMHSTPLSPGFYAWFNAFIAGPAEEGARYIGYRRRPTASWSEGVMYGLGHGALESILFKTTSAVWAIAILEYFPQLHPDNEFAKGFVKGVMQHWAKIAAIPVWLPALNTVAIAGVQAIHVFSALLVLQCFRRNQLRWLFYAMIFHSSFDLLVTGIARAHQGLAAVVSICGATACLYLAIQMRAPAPREQLELALS